MKTDELIESFLIKVLVLVGIISMILVTVL